MVAEQVVEQQAAPKLTRKDFASSADPRWCPGCGDYSILAQTQKMLPNLGVPREKLVFISGIGCASRFPYYMNTYGFHSIHGRAPTLATGLKVARPDLQIWVITGDGDALSIGGNHFLHALRRNIDINIILFNNRIYGLTKGQYSPTSELGKRTKSSPMGSIDAPINPISVALAAEATFVARSFDTDPPHLIETLERAARHRGGSFVEVYQNCNIFNDGTYRAFTDKPVRRQRMLYLKDGEPMRFGAEQEMAVRLNGLAAECVNLQEEPDAEPLVHDASRTDPSVAHLLARMSHPEMPVPVGVFRDVEKPTYDTLLEEQIETARAQQGQGDIRALLRGDTTWQVE